MRGFPSQLEVAARFEIEARPGGLQLTYSGRPFLDKDLDGLRITECCAGCQCVPPVQLRRVSRAKRRSDSTLRVGCCAVEQRAFGEHHHLAFRRCAKRGVQTRNAASNNEKACPNAVWHRVKSIGNDWR